MQNQRESIDRLAGHQDIELHQIAFAEIDKFVIERRIAARNRLQTIIEVEHDLIQRQLVCQHHAVGRMYSKPLWVPRFSSSKGRMPPRNSSGVRMTALIIGSSILEMRTDSGILAGESISVVAPSVVVTR